MRYYANQYGRPEFYEVVDILEKRLNDRGRQWRHVVKALKVLDHILREGSEIVVTWTRENIKIISALQLYSYKSQHHVDIGYLVTVPAKELLENDGWNKGISSPRGDWHIPPR